MRLRVKEARREEFRRDRPQSASSPAEEWGREASLHLVPEYDHTWCGLEKEALIVAVVGVGNVSQLCMDLLISTLKTNFVGYLESPCIPALVGAAPYSTDPGKPFLAGSLELYHVPDRKTFLLQTRAPNFAGTRKKFAAELQNFVLQHKFSKVVLLSSSFAMARKDAQLLGLPVEFAMTGFPDSANQLLRSLGLSEIPKEEGPNGDTSERRRNIPGSGCAEALFSSLSSGGVSTALLNFFTSEGDNRGDAVYMANLLDSWLHLLSPQAVSAGVDPTKWRTPDCWKFLYGADPDPALY
ncbi:Proteasome assembly chaperone 2 [Sparganum proliferum]